MKIVDIDITEQMAFSWPHSEIEGWRNYRIEYGGCNSSCYWEGNVWFPPEVDPYVCGYKFFEILQVPEARKKFEEAVRKIHKEDVGKLSNWKD